MDVSESSLPTYDQTHAELSLEIFFIIDGRSAVFYLLFCFYPILFYYFIKKLQGEKCSGKIEIQYGKSGNLYNRKTIRR